MKGPKTGIRSRGLNSSTSVVTTPTGTTTLAMMTCTRSQSMGVRIRLLRLQRGLLLPARMQFLIAPASLLPCCSLLDVWLTATKNATHTLRLPSCQAAANCCDAQQTRRERPKPAAARRGGAHLQHCVSACVPASKLASPTLHMGRRQQRRVFSPLCVHKRRRAEAAARGGVNCGSMRCSAAGRRALTCEQHEASMAAEHPAAGRQRRVSAEALFRRRGGGVLFAKWHAQRSLDSKAGRGRAHGRTEPAGPAHATSSHIAPATASHWA